MKTNTETEFVLHLKTFQASPSSKQTAVKIVFDLSRGKLVSEIRIGSRWHGISECIDAGEVRKARDMLNAWLELAAFRDGRTAADRS